MHGSWVRVTGLGLAVGCGLCVGRVALADGGYFPSNVNTASEAETTDQRAILLYEQGYTTLILQTGYQGSGDGFSWVIPTASLVTAEDIEVITTPVFDGLHAETAPMLVTFTQGCGAYGCAGSDTGSETGSGSEVRVFDAFKVDNYEVAVLGATDSQNLVGWLNTNGYRTPANAGAVFGDYVDRSFYFVAVRFQRPVEDPRTIGGDADSTGTPDANAAKPLAIRFAGAMRTFPLLISSLSTQQTVDLVLYTIDTRRYTVLNFPTADMQIGDAFEGEDFTGWYNQRLEAAIAANGGNAFMVEFAATLDGYQLASALGRTPNAATAGEESWFVTRFRTRLPPEAMTQDVQVAPLQGDEATALHRIRVMQGGKPGRVAASLPLDLTFIVALGLVLQWRRRRRGGA